jgi:hypothetical protein
VSNSFLDPTHGWGRLLISESGMTRILNHIGVFPKFFKFLSAFGIKGFPRDEGFGGFDAVLSRNEDGHLDAIGTPGPFNYYAWV